MKQDRRGHHMKKRPVPEALKKHAFKKGQSGNPLGFKENPAIKALKNLTIETYREVIEIALTSNVAELRRIMRDPNTSAVQVGVARALVKAINYGDWSILEQIASRIVGKVPDKLEVNSKNNTHLAVVDKTKMAAALKELEDSV